MLPEIVLSLLRSVVETTETAIPLCTDSELVQLVNTVTLLGHNLADVLVISAAAANAISFEHFQSKTTVCEKLDESNVQ